MPASAQAGNDEGTQCHGKSGIHATSSSMHSSHGMSHCNPRRYRSGIYYHNDEQKAAAEASIKSLEDPGSGLSNLSWCKDLAPGASWRKGGDRSRSCCALLACGGRHGTFVGK